MDRSSIFYGKSSSFPEALLPDPKFFRWSLGLFSFLLGEAEWQQLIAACQRALAKAPWGWGWEDLMEACHETYGKPMENI